MAEYKVILELNYLQKQELLSALEHSLTDESQYLEQEEAIQNLIRELNHANPSTP